MDRIKFHAPVIKPLTGEVIKGTYFIMRDERFGNGGVVKESQYTLRPEAKYFVDKSSVFASVGKLSNSSDVINKSFVSGNTHIISSTIDKTAIEGGLVTSSKIVESSVSMCGRSSISDSFVKSCNISGSIKILNSHVINTDITGDVRIIGGVWITGTHNSIESGDNELILLGDCRIDGFAEITSPDDIFTVSNIGVKNGMYTAYRALDPDVLDGEIDIRVVCDFGVFWLGEFRSYILDKFKDQEDLRNEYVSLHELTEKKLRRRL